ncbi:MAG TPA: DUF502 domain-containing protein [Polyangiaceae bacterium]|nr:DUF502 domain-containing protein [Polyangiaceae bacterium]
MDFRLRRMNFRQILRDLPGYLLRGALITGPLVATAYVLYFMFRTVDELMPIGIPGLGLVLTMVLVALVGYLSANVIGSGILESIERFVQRVPFVKLVYSSIKDLINAFVGDRKSFDKPVLVRLSPDDSVRALGFVTRDALLGLGLTEHVAVYLPQSYNFAGNLLIVPREAVQPLAVPSGELMTFIVSGGVSGLGVGGPALPAASQRPSAAPEARG